MSKLVSWKTACFGYFRSIDKSSITEKYNAYDGKLKQLKTKNEEFVNGWRAHKKAINWIIAILVLLLVVCVIVQMGRPAKPEVSLDGIRLEKITTKHITVDLTINVVNKCYYTLKYEAVDVTIFFKDNALANVQSAEGAINSQATSTIPVTVDLKVSDIFRNAFSLIKSAVKGTIAIRSQTQFSATAGYMGLSLLHLQLRISCEHELHTDDGTTSTQNCVFERI